MDIGDMDIEEFQVAWRRARRDWDLVKQRRLEIEAAGQQLTSEERSAWLAAKARFEEYEQAWDQAYQMGVVVIVGDDEDSGELGE
jgi:hypothetical protein